MTASARADSPPVGLIALVRHGETEWNRQRRIQGATDVPLNETGRAQARATGAVLGTRRWSMIAASPLSRALETAQIVAAELGLPSPLVIPELVERNYGLAEGLDYEQLRLQFPEDVDVPGRETHAEVAARAMPALARLTASYPSDDLIVVTHGGLIRSVLGVVDAGASHPAIANGSIHTLIHGPGSLRLRRFDDPLAGPADSVSADSATGIDAQNAAERAG